MATAALVAAGAVVGVNSASAVTGASCVLPAGASVADCSVRFEYTGSEQSFSVPAGATSVNLTAIGARGGANSRTGTPGGRGESVTRTAAVAPGQILYVQVGGAGLPSRIDQSTAPVAGGYNGGGAALQSFAVGGGSGGGASDVRTVTTSAPGSLESRLIVGGAGGGAGLEAAGGGAGQDGGLGNYQVPGRAGTSTAGGVGNSEAGRPTKGGNGALGVGGQSADWGGAGGAGLFGGGGGGSYSGGGGGSSLGASLGLTTAAASVTVTYSSLPASGITISAPANAVAGTSAVLAASAVDPRGDTWPASSSVVFSSSNPTDVVTGSTVRFGVAGARTIVATQGALSSAAQVAVAPGPLSALVVTGSAASVTAGDSATFTASGRDAGGTDLGDVTSQTAFTTGNSSDAIAGASIDFGVAGPRTVVAVSGSASGSTTLSVVTGPLRTVTVAVPDGSPLAGSTAAVTASGRDAGGTDLGDITGATVFTSSEPTDRISGGSIRYGVAGERTITGTNGSIEGAATVTVLVGPPATLIVTVSETSVVAGETAFFTVRGRDAGGTDLGDLTAASILTSSNGSDEVSGAGIRFSASGTRTVTATNGAATGTVQIQVSTGALDSITILPGEVDGIAGESQAFTVSGWDAEDNSLGDVTSDAALVSSVDSDVVTANVVAFEAAGERVVTASLDGLAATAEVSVSAAPLHRIVVAASSASLVAGGTVAFTTAGEDRFGNTRGDLTDVTTFAGSAETDSVEGNEITFVTAGDNTVTASVAGFSAAVIVEVLADSDAPAEIRMLSSAAVVDRGGSITLRVNGTDRFGNEIAGLTERAVFTSDWAVDVITGSTITFPHASTHTITATLGALQSVVVVEVNEPVSLPAAIAASVLARTGTEPVLPATLGLSALLLGMGAVLFSLRRRRARE